MHNALTENRRSLEMGRKKPQALDVAGLLPSWQLLMAAERKSPVTIKTYSAGIHRLLDRCAETGVPPVPS